MGFAELSIADIAAEYAIEQQAVFELCDRFKINYKNERTCLALEDAKAIIMEILAAQTNSGSADS
ncbi:MAG: translation initiation factor IF-2 [Cyanobacteria bacterium P01_A01_bin.40]